MTSYILGIIERSIFSRLKLKSIAILRLIIVLSSKFLNFKWTNPDKDSLILRMKTLKISIGTYLHSRLWKTSLFMHKNLVSQWKVPLNLESKAHISLAEPGSWMWCLDSQNLWNANLISRNIVWAKWKTTWPNCHKEWWVLARFHTSSFGEYH